MTSPTPRSGAAAPARRLALRSVRRAGAAVLSLGVAASLCAVTSPAAAEDGHDQLRRQYGSLSSSLVGFYAGRSNQSLSQFLGSQQLLIQPPSVTFDDAASGLDGTLGDLESQEPGIDPAAPSPGDESSAPDADLSGDFDFSTFSFSGEGAGLLLTSDQVSTLSTGLQPISANSIADLDRQLSASGLTLSTKKYRSLSALARDVSRSAKTPDGAVTLATAAWASQLASLHAPSVSSPGTPSASMPGVPADALPLGLLMNESLSNLVTNHPDLIAQAQNNHGLGSPALQAAWNSSMAQAYANSSQDLNGLLANPCVGDMMGVMATGSGKAASGNCSSACTIAGQYLHNQAGAAFDGSQNSFSSNAQNPAGGILNHATLTNMNLWAQNLIVGQNPSLVLGSDPASSVGNGPSDCMGASGGTKGALEQKLPGLFNGLR